MQDEAFRVNLGQRFRLRDLGASQRLFLALMGNNGPSDLKHIRIGLLLQVLQPLQLLDGELNLLLLGLDALLLVFVDVQQASNLRLQVSPQDLLPLALRQEIVVEQR